MIYSPTTVSLVNSPGLVITDLQRISIIKQPSELTQSTHLVKSSTIFASVCNSAVIGRLRVVRSLGPLAQRLRQCWRIRWNLRLVGRWTRIRIGLPASARPYARYDTDCLQRCSLFCLNFASCENGGKGSCEYGFEGDTKREDCSGSTWESC